MKTVIMLAGLCTVVSSNALAIEWNDLWQRPDQQAYKLLQNGDSTSAAQVFSDPQWRGVSHYRAGELDQAQEEFSSSESNTGLYNQGVTAVHQGEYDLAIEKFESLLQRVPDHEDGQHNLEIARALANQEQQDEQQQEQQQNDESQQQDQSGEKQQQGEQSEGDQSQGEQSQSDSSEGDQGEAAGEEERGGELTAEPEDAATGDSQDSIEPQADPQSAAQQESDQSMQPQSGEPEPGEADAEQQAAALTDAGPSESEQATEQWLRRIPDDPSQLLRNKIKLNHMIEHADVQDMQEPW